MGKKLTYQEVKNYIESRKHVLLDDVYINDHTHLQLLCPNKHKYSIILNSFKNGRRCPVCKGIETTKRQRTPYESIQKLVDELERKLITTKEEYETNYSKENKFFLIECVCGNSHKTTIDRLRKKCFCKICSNKQTGDRCRYPLEKVKEIVESKKFILLSTVYKNDSTDLEVLCDKGHNFLVRFSDLKRKNSGCPDCKKSNTSERCRTPYKKLIKTALSKNLKVLMPNEIYDQNFKGENKKIGIECLICKHIFSTTPARLNFGFGCEPCGIKRSAEKRKKPYEDVKLSVEKAGYKLISENYIGNQEDLIVRCSKHGNFITCLNSILNGHGCRKCFSRGGKAQKEIYDFIESLSILVIENDRKQIAPKEIDIFIPSLNLAIEYCGLRYHSEQFGKNSNYHHNKMKLCNEKGIRLITIFEDEWLERQDQVRNFLLSVLNKNSIKIMGRKTEIRKVPKLEASLFLEANHIQGSTIFEIAFGLYFNNELQAIITGNKHHRQGHSNLFVLNRLAFKSEVSVSGGSSKLLKALISYVKEKGYRKLISWSDNRWSEGRVYEKLGFELTEKLPPDYSYVDKQKRISKQSCQKKNLSKKGAIGNTEKEMALSLKLYRIWDCGKKRWEIKL